jgi:hypothetical protein
MTTRVASLTFAVVAVVAVMAPAGAATAPSDADCSVDAARKYRVKPALARGLPVTVTCDGPATFFVAMRFTGHGEDHISRAAHPGYEGFSATVDLADAGSRTIRVKLAKYAKRAAKKNLAERRAFPIFFNMGIERADGNFHNIPKPAAQPYAKIAR